MTERADIDPAPCDDGSPATTAVEVAPITAFRGPFFALSNFAPHPTEFGGVLYPTSEHAYIAAKTVDIGVREQIRILPTADAKDLGQAITLRADWNAVRDDVMFMILHDKFTRNALAAQVLRSTGSRELIEGNTWHDNYWGRCVCDRCDTAGVVGSNRLGEMLMTIRRQMHQQV